MGHSSQGPETGCGTDGTCHHGGRGAGETTSYHGQPAAPDSAAEASVPEGLRDHPRYEVLERIGAGGMGTVYRARHRLMDRLVALKVINAHLVGRPNMVRRFHREMRAAARLVHPNIVAAYDADRAGDTHFLVMELVEGANLDRLLAEEGRLPLAVACDYARQVALALQHAHERGMVHRDVKPHNLMRTAEGQIKVLDFGLARFVSEVLPPAVGPVAGGDGGAAAGLTSASNALGTADYISPEEARDARRADIRADVYSLGCTLYHFLAGCPPFPGGSAPDKLRCHLEQAPRPVRELRPDAPPELAAVLRKMLAKQPTQRFQEPWEVAQALAPFAAEGLGLVLVVDDDPSVRAGLTQALTRKGHAVSTAVNGEEALRQLRGATPPSLILLDLMMPVMDGWQLLEALQKEGPRLASIPVVVLTAAARAEARAQALGVAHFLQKPFEVEQVADQVGRLTGQAGPTPG